MDVLKVKWFLFAAFLLYFNPSFTTGHEIEKRQAKKYDFMFWVNKELLYRFVSHFSAAEKKMIREAMDTWESLACVRFKEGTVADPVTVDIQRNETGCFSLVGSLQMLVIVDKSRKAIRQPLNLGLNCMKHSIITHELGHSLGLYHEHERLIRDKYVRLYKQNIQDKYFNQFKIQKEQRSYGLPYSYRSIMHYGKSYFSNGNGISMLSKDPKFIDIIGKVRRPSFKDVQIMNLMYKCTRRCGKDAQPCPQGAMRGPNCRCWCRSKLFSAVDCETGVAVDKKQARHSSGYVMRFRDGQSFFWSKDQVSWYDADQGCKLLDGHLVNIQSQKVDKRLALMYKKLRESKSYEKVNIPLFWSGGNDHSKEGEFKWTNGEAIDMSMLKFPRGEPNNQMNEDCLAFASMTSGNKYVDWDCGSRHNFICELPNTGCHDTSTMCKYYKKIGQCHTKETKHHCKKSCSLCSKKSTSSEVTTPQPFIEDETSSPTQPTPEHIGTTPAPEDVETIQTPEDVETTPAPSSEPAESLTTMVPASKPKRCFRASCGSHVMVLPIFRLNEGAKFCVKCPDCGCKYSRVIGMKTYSMYSHVCCAIKQAKGRSAGLHTLTRGGPRQYLTGGIKNGVRSRSYYRKTKATFSVDVQPSTRIASVPFTACRALTCRQSFLDQSWYSRLSPGTTFCVKCLSCDCSDVELFGFRRYSHNSPACCAVKQMTGRSEGQHRLRRRGLANSLQGDTANGITSEGVFGIWRYTYEVLSDKKCDGPKKKLGCTENLLKSQAWKNLSIGETMCVQCSACSCNTTRVWGYKVYHPKSAACCAAKQMKDRAEGWHKVQKVGGIMFYRGGTFNGVMSSRAGSISPWAFEFSDVE